MRAVAYERFEPEPEPPLIAEGWAGSTDAPQPARLKSLAQFLGEYVPLSYALEPIVRTGSLYTLTARTGAGKTAWMISTALAVVTGRSDIVGREVEAGRVAFLTFENPDDVRMRLMIAAFTLGVDVRTISERLMILDVRVKPEAVEAELRDASSVEPFRLIFIDTLAAFFDGNDINDAVQGGEFARRLRPLTRLPGLPAVVVAAHPVKNATEDQLVPYGSGAILNEVDGNLTLWRRPDSGTVRFHWSGKLRGLEFEPSEYRFEIGGSPDVLDAKGRQVQLPTMLPATALDDATKEKADLDVKVALLRAVQADPKATQRDLAALVERSPSVVNGKLKQLKAEKLADLVLGAWSLTTKGEKALARAG